MKFVSKSGNYRLILDRGIPAEPLTGRNAMPGLSIKFEDGVAIVTDESIIQRMVSHPAFNRDFIKVEEGETDPFAVRRQSKEPEHDVTNIEYGHIGRNANPRSPIPMTPEMKKALTDIAVNMAKEMAPALALEMLKKMKADSELATTTKKVGKTKKAQKIVSAPEEGAGAIEG